MSLDNRKKLIITGLSLFYTMALYVLFLFTHPVYFHSDNWEVAVVTAGYYGSVFCQYLHPLLCLIIKSMGYLLPTADVFTLLIHLAIGVGITLIVYLALNDFFRKPVHRISEYLFVLNTLLAALFLTGGLRIWNANYNIQTGAILFLGMTILFIALHQQRSARWIIVADVMIIFGLMLRVAVAFLFIPYFGLLVFTEILSNWDGDSWEMETKRLIGVGKYIIPMVVLAALLMLSRTVMLSIEPYNASERYNRYRTISVDYPMKNWSDLDNPDFSQVDYAAVTNWVFIDTDGLSSDAFKKIAEAAAKNEYDVLDYHRILNSMWRQVKSIDIYMFVLFLLTIVLAVRNLICSVSRWHKLETLLTIAGSFIILYYFTFRGRAPLRVWQPVLFAADAVLICVALKERSTSISSSIFSLLILALLWYGAGQVIAHAKIVSPQNILTARINIDDSVYAETYEGDGIYIWPNWHATIPQYFIGIGKLPTQRVIDHNMAAGDWTYGQVYYEEYLDRLGIPNPADALVNRENTFLMSGNNELVLEYLREHYGDDLDLEIAGEVNSTSAYRIIKADKQESQSEEKKE